MDARPMPEGNLDAATAFSWLVDKLVERSVEAHTFRERMGDTQGDLRSAIVNLDASRKAVGEQGDHIVKLSTENIALVAERDSLKTGAAALLRAAIVLSSAASMVITPHKDGEQIPRKEWIRRFKKARAALVDRLTDSMLLLAVDANDAAAELGKVDWPEKKRRRATATKKRRRR